MSKLSSIFLPALILSLTGNAWATSAAPAQLSVQLLASGKVDLVADTITVPLHQGHLKDGKSVWYVLIDASDEAQATAQGLVYAPALASAASDPSTRTVTFDFNDGWIFDHGTVDFSGARSVTPGDAPNLFPPKAATPGSTGDSSYSPYVKIGTGGNAVVYNAPIVAFDVSADAVSFCDASKPVNHSIVHDKVVRICPASGEVTLALSHGWASDKPLIYVSLDSNNPIASAMEGATYAPALNSLKSSGTSLPLYAVTNGQTGKDNPERQGFNSALMGEGSPLNVLTGIPTLSALPYSPLWDLHIAEWTDAAVASEKRVVLTSAQQFNTYAKAGLLSGVGGAGLPSSGLLVNCPAVGILQ